MCIHESIFVQIVSTNLHLGAFLPHSGALLLHFSAFLLHSGAFPFRTPVPNHSDIFFRTSVPDSVNPTTRTRR